MLAFNYLMSQFVTSDTYKMPFSCVAFTLNCVSKATLKANEQLILFLVSASKKLDATCCHFL